MESKRVVIGSRGSALALWQANHIAGSLHRMNVSTRIEVIRTSGDHLQSASLVKGGGKGLFTKEIEDALLEGAIDIAVHSLKDLPTTMPPGLVIAAIPEREDPRDALLGHTLDKLPQGARIGTSSPRRSAQLLHMRRDLEIVPIRGNVDTRLRKLRDREYDAIVLAAAGLRRLGLENEIAELLPPEIICCAPGQGALAVETRESGPAKRICEALNHEDSARSVTCERSVLAALGGGCQLPVGAFAHITGSELHATAVVASPDGEHLVRDSAIGPAAEPEQLGRLLADRLQSHGAAALLEAFSPPTLP